jgi:ribonuclease BN (tRNA processing enzyme)
MRSLWLSLLCLATTTVCANGVAQCPPDEGVALQVLGSGGPIADDGRASSAYLIWIDGRSRVLIDAGGGAFLRFGEAGADFLALDFIGLSHLHTDHSADFPALLKSGYFSGRERPLTVAGPGAGGPFPAIRDYLQSLIGSDSGAYGYLSGYLDGSGRLAKLEVREIARKQSTPVEVFGDEKGLSVEAMPVPHGIVPALGFHVRVGNSSIVFASDQNGSDSKFTEFAKGANLLVMHMAVPENASGSALQLHAKPSRIAAIAQESGADSLLLSHFMARSLRDLEGNLDVVRRGYDGEIVVAEDLACMVIEN